MDYRNIRNPNDFSHQLIHVFLVRRKEALLIRGWLLSEYMRMNRSIVDVDCFFCPASTRAKHLYFDQSLTRRAVRWGWINLRHSSLVRRSSTPGSNSRFSHSWSIRKEVPIMATSLLLRSACTASFLALSAIGIYHFQYLPAHLKIPLNFEDILRNKHLNVPYQHISIPQRYTGIQSIDSFIAVYVTAFAHGPLRLDEHAYWQQLYFLVGIFPILAVWTVEANRERNRGTVISYTSVWAIFYQALGGAVFLPLHDLCYIFVARRPSYLRAGRAVPVHVAKALIPALLIGYLLPTCLLFIRRYSQQTVLYLIAVWQFTPFYINILVGIFGSMLKTSPTSTNKAMSSESNYLITVYLISVLASATAHITTLSGILSGNPAEVSLASIFLPSQSRLLKSTGQDLHHIFQWDWIVIATSSFIWALYAVAEISAERQVLGMKHSSTRIISLMAISTILLGPGGTLAAVWWWREIALIEIENNIKSKGKW